MKQKLAWALKTGIVREQFRHKGPVLAYYANKLAQSINAYLVLIVMEYFLGAGFSRKKISCKDSTGSAVFQTCIYRFYFKQGTFAEEVHKNNYIEMDKINFKYLIFWRTW